MDYPTCNAQAITTLAEMNASLDLERDVFVKPVPDPAPQITCPEEAFQYCRDMGGLSREFMAALLIDHKGKLIRRHIIGVGDWDHVEGSCRQVFKAAILHDAACLCILHNHPHEDQPVPSPQDRRYFGIMQAAGEMLQIPVTDSIVVGSEGYVSLKREQDNKRQSPWDLVQELKRLADTPAKKAIADAMEKMVEEVHSAKGSDS